jgi:tRNA threonylcarbamoyladenosine modification (KEOPS) complex Cgi121 subunit
MIIKNLGDSPWKICILGLKNVNVGDVDGFLSNIKDRVRLDFQVFNADRIASWRHVFFGAVNAVEAFKNGLQVSNNIPIETLLYVSCQDQIVKALNTVGIKRGVERIVFVIFAKSNAEFKGLNSKLGAFGVQDDSIMEVTYDKLEALKCIFEVSETSLESIGGDLSEALTSLIIEKGALIPTLR